MTTRTWRVLGATLLCVGAATVAGCTTSSPGSAGATSSTASTTTSSVPVGAPTAGGPDCTPRTYRQGADFGIGCDFRGLTLSVDVSPLIENDGATITRTYGPEAWLQGTTFTGANLSMANFKYSHAHGARFVDSNLSGTYLLDTDLSDAQFVNVDLRGAELGGATVQGATWTGVQIDTTTTCPDHLTWSTTDGCRGSLGPL
jgi:hypothetical protein